MTMQLLLQTFLFFILEMIYRVSIHPDTTVSTCLKHFLSTCRITCLWQFKMLCLPFSRRHSCQKGTDLAESTHGSASAMWEPSEIPDIQLTISQSGVGWATITPPSLGYNTQQKKKKHWQQISTSKEKTKEHLYKYQIKPLNETTSAIHTPYPIKSITSVTATFNYHDDKVNNNGQDCMSSKFTLKKELRWISEWMLSAVSHAHQSKFMEMLIKALHALTHVRTRQGSLM